MDTDRYTRPTPRRRSNHTGSVPDTLKVLGFVAVLALIVVGTIVGVRQHNARVNHCKARGGHVVSHTVYLHGDSDTTHYCLTATGGTLDVW